MKMVRLGSSQIYRGQMWLWRGPSKSQSKHTFQVLPIFCIVRLSTLACIHDEQICNLFFYFLQALLMDSGEWSHFVQQQFCLAEDYYGHVVSRLFFQCQRWQRFAECNFSAHWVWWWYGPAKVEPQGQNVPKLREELEGKTVKKAETAKDIIDSEWRVVLRACELSVCCVDPAGQRQARGISINLALYNH